MSGALRFIEKLASGPWLCEQEHVEFLHSILTSYLDRAAAGQPLDREAVEQTLGRPLDNTREVTVKDGVARIPVEGTIVRRANLFTEISGGVSTEMLAKDFISAYNDSTVHSILFVFDSPGGEATGIGELAALVREKRDQGNPDKRIEAYCDGLCASGAYWLASATEWITTDPTAALGSIGVVTRVRNPEAAGKKLTLEFWNARSPKKRLDPTSYEGQTAIQEYVDDLGDEFIKAVADNRGVSPEKVAEEFGQGFVLVGRRAVDVGMADALGSEGEVVGRLQRRETGPARENVGAGVGAGMAQGTLAAELAGSRRVGATEREVGTQVSEAKPGGTREKMVTDEAGERDPVREEKRAEGFMSHMRSFFLGEGPSVSASEATSEANSREESDREMTEAKEVREAPRADAEENEGLRRRVEELESQVEALAERNAAMARSLAEERVDAQIARYHASGTPPYLTASARPDLIEAQLNASDEAAQERAGRWRTTLDSPPVKVEFGERGDSGADASTPGVGDEAKVHAYALEHGCGEDEAWDALANEGKVAF